jgi:hypothetical protein
MHGIKLYACICKDLVEVSKAEFYFLAIKKKKKKNIEAKEFEEFR